MPTIPSPPPAASMLPPSTQETEPWPSCHATVSLVACTSSRPGYGAPQSRCSSTRSCPVGVFLTFSSVVELLRPPVTEIAIPITRTRIPTYDSLGYRRCSSHASVRLDPRSRNRDPRGKSRHITKWRWGESNPRVRATDWGFSGRIRRIRSRLEAPTGGGPFGQPGCDVPQRPPDGADQVSLLGDARPPTAGTRGERLPN
jgi:hypothetical protein